MLVHLELTILGYYNHKNGDIKVSEEKVIWLKEEPTESACHICGNKKNNRIILRALHWQPENGMLDVAICGNCSSAWFIGSIERNTPYPTAEVVLQDPNFIFLIYHYFEMVNGLDWKIHILEKLPYEKFTSIMEVGCNVGIALDFCKTAWGVKDIVGVEPSAYGVVGKDLLNISIHNKYLDEINSIKGKKFDFIFATEVVEHVVDPLSFIKELRGFLNSGGTLLLTTPRSSSLNKSTSPGELYAALSPGSHYFLLSDKKLKELGKLAGFSSIHIEPFGMTNVAVLSDTDVSVHNKIYSTNKLLHYYEKKQNMLPHDDRVALSYMINYFVMIHKNNDLPADYLKNSIEVKLRKIFNFDMDNSDLFIDKIIDCETIFDLGRLFPYSTPFFLYGIACGSSSNEKSADYYLYFARLIALQGLKIDFQNLFLYHELLENINLKLGDLKISKSSISLKEKGDFILKSIPEIESTKKPSLKRKMKDFFNKIITNRQFS